MEQLYTFGDVARDPRTRVISCSYMALVDSSSLEIKAGEDADEVQWFKVKYTLFKEKKTLSKEGYIYEKLVKPTLCSEDKDLSAVVKITENVAGRVTKIEREVIETNDIAFDHEKFIVYALERLRNKIEYTNLVFNLMPEFLTITELQQVFEIILDKELLAATFKRKVVDMVIETKEFTKDAGHRPSKLYRFNNEWGKNK